MMMASANRCVRRREHVRHGRFSSVGICVIASDLVNGNSSRPTIFRFYSHFCLLVPSHIFMWLAADGDRHFGEDSDRETPQCPPEAVHDAHRPSRDRRVRSLLRDLPAARAGRRGRGGPARGAGDDHGAPGGRAHAAAGRAPLRAGQVERQAGARAPRRHRAGVRVPRAVVRARRDSRRCRAWTRICGARRPAPTRARSPTSAASWPTLRQLSLELFASLPPEAWQRRGVASERVLSVRAVPWIIAGHERHHLEILRERYGLV